MRAWRCTGLLCVSCLLAACAKQPGGLDVAQLLYDEQEAGTDVYPVRILVGQDYLRIDDGSDAGDFVLLERGSRQVYSVSHEERSILVIDYQPVEAGVPDSLDLSVTASADATAPAIAGIQPVDHSYLANGQVCLQSVTVPGLLDAAVEGMAQYARVLAARQYHHMGSVPDFMQEPCFLARYVYAADRHLQDGLPLQLWDNAGYRRSLVDYTASRRVPAALFSLPEGYTEFSPG